MRRLKTVRRPPYPKWNPGHLPCSSLTHPLPLSSRRPSVSFGGFGVRGILDALDNIVDRWDPQEVACGKPSPMQLVRQQEGMEKLGVALERWAREHKLRMCCYPHRDIRSALSGRPNAAKEELAYAVMAGGACWGQGRAPMNGML